MELALLQELLMALRANDSDGYKSWLALGIEQLGRDVAGEVGSEWMVPLLLEEERQADGLVAGRESLVLLGDKHLSKDRSDEGFGFSPFQRL